MDATEASRPENRIEQGLGVLFVLSPCAGMVGTNMATAPREITAIRASLWRKSICSPKPYIASRNPKSGCGTGFARTIVPRRHSLLLPLLLPLPLPLPLLRFLYASYYQDYYHYACTNTTTTT